MVFNVFRAILCCCQSSDENDDRQAHDERMHLIIPETIEATAEYTEDGRPNQRRLRERLTEIVRSTEGKMVNVASRIPFNLHNRVITKTNSHSSSRSTLDSVNPYHDHSFHPDFYSNRDKAHLRKERSNHYHGLGRLRSTSPSFYGPEVGPSIRTRSPSPTAEQTGPARLLNIKLVGYTDPRTRGRARERTLHSTGLPGSRTENPTSVDVVSEIHGSASAEGSPSSAPRPVTFALQLPDVDAMILTWD